MRYLIECVCFRCRTMGKLFEDHGKRLKWFGGERVLDLGCGVGDVTRRIILPLLPQNYGSLTCADASTHMLCAAQKELEGVRNVEFLVMDIEVDLQVSLLGSFHKIFSTFCLMFMEDQRKVYENVWKLLAPGGECFIIILVTGTIFETGFHLAETPKWCEHLKHYRKTFVFPYREDPNPERTVINLLQSTGYSDVFVKKDNVFDVYPTVEDLRDNIRAMPSFPNNMTQQDKEDLLEDQVKFGLTLNSVQECLDESKPIEPRRVTLTIHARKPLN
uniref:Putative juvenile hormone acid o-methyltransferase n=1 Tax=Nyssomyia neivai TaxID=330878 RepID=A0A1L8DK59_9DIPT